MTLEDCLPSSKWSVNVSGFRKRNRILTSMYSGASLDWAGPPACTFTGRVTLGSYFLLSGLRFSHVENGNNNSISERCRGVIELRSVKSFRTVRVWFKGLLLLLLLLYKVASFQLWFLLSLPPTFLLKNKPRNLNNR